MNMNQKYCNGMIHAIKKGESLYQLSRMYRVPLALILRANPYLDVYNLQPGQEICIPVTRGNHMRPMPMPRASAPEAPVERDDREDRAAETETEGPEPGESIDSEPRVVEDERAEMERENADQPEIREYVADGVMSLGEILDTAQADLDDLLECNNLNHVIIAADVVLYLPKKV